MSLEWCCDDAYETCGPVGLCIPKFQNPVRSYTKQIKDYTMATLGGSFTSYYPAEVSGNYFSQYGVSYEAVITTQATFTTRTSTATTAYVAKNTPAAAIGDSSNTLSSSEAANTGGVSSKASDNDSNDMEKSGGISAGTAAGAGVGGSLGLIAIIAGIFFYRRHSKRAAAAASSASDASAAEAAGRLPATSSVEGLKANYYTETSPAPELSGTPLYQELPPAQQRVNYELAGSPVSGELDGNGRRS